MGDLISKASMSEAVVGLRNEISPSEGDSDALRDRRAELQLLEAAKGLR